MQKQDAKYNNKDIKYNTAGIKYNCIVFQSQ